MRPPLHCLSTSSRTPAGWASQRICPVHRPEAPAARACACESAHAMAAPDAAVAWDDEELSASPISLGEADRIATSLRQLANKVRA
jgi:hypothetical protein